MNISYFLAQVFGLYLIVAGISVLVKHRAWSQVVDSFIENAALLHITGVFVFIMGLLLILCHNVWEGSWRVVVTILCWMTFLKGLAFFLLPHATLARYVKSINNKGWYTVSGISCIILGTLLALKGFSII